MIRNHHHNIVFVLLVVAAANYSILVLEVSSDLPTRFLSTQEKHQDFTSRLPDVQPTKSLVNDSPHIPSLEKDGRSPTTSSSVGSSSTSNTSLVDLIKPRAFEARPLDKFPCFLEDPTTKWWKVGNESSRISEGFLFLKTHKTGSSTGAGIHLRIARNVAAARLAASTDQQGKSNASSHLPPMCRSRFHHSTARKMNYGSRSPDKSFLWTILRDPTERAVSQFFHFEVSRRNTEATKENLRAFLLSKRSRIDGYYLRMLSLRDYPATLNHETHSSQQSKMVASSTAVQDIIKDYDFIAITERMDESAVALQMLLGLGTADIMYLNAKGSGGFDAGGYQGKCTHIKPKNVTAGMRTFLRESPEWKRRVEWDTHLYKAANDSLDKTIDALGRQAFQRQLRTFQNAQEISKQKCLSTVEFPCSSSRSGQPPLRRNETDCLWKDSGCGINCLDSVASSLGI